MLKKDDIMATDQRQNKPEVDTDKSIPQDWGTELKEHIENGPFERQKLCELTQDFQINDNTVIHGNEQYLLHNYLTDDLTYSGRYNGSLIDIIKTLHSNNSNKYHIGIAPGHPTSPDNEKLYAFFERYGSYRFIMSNLAPNLTQRVIENVLIEKDTEIINNIEKVQSILEKNTNENYYQWNIYAIPIYENNPEMVFIRGIHTQFFRKDNNYIITHIDGKIYIYNPDEYEFALGTNLREVKTPLQKHIFSIVSRENLTPIPEQIFFDVCQATFYDSPLIIKFLYENPEH